MRTALALALVATALAPVGARADRSELYTHVSIEPAIQHITDAYSQDASAQAVGAGFALSTYYGLTNRLHLGGVARATDTRNIQLSPITTQLSSGTQTGTLYEDHRTYQVAALLLYRMDTGTRFAPTLSLEAGVGSYAYSNRALQPTGANYALPVPDVSYLALYARPAVGLEYRGWDHVVASLSVGASLAPSAHEQWAIAVPLSVAYVW